MADRRRGSKSAHDSPSALDIQPPAKVFRPRLQLRWRPSIALLDLLTVVLLSVSFAPFGHWYMAYVALVPWALTLVNRELRRWTLLCAWLAGVVFWACNLYWMMWITLVGYGASVVYLSLYWLVAAVIFRAARDRNWPAWIVLPVIWVALEYARAYVIGGFPWFFLAHSQYTQTRLIQISDLTGQYGVSFFVAMINGAVIDLLVCPLFVRKPGGTALNKQILLAVIACVVATAGLLVYGGWRIGQRAESVEPGPVVGIVQQAFPISLVGRSASADKIFEDHLRSSEDFLSGGADLVIWPETMLPRGLNREFLEADLSAMGPDELRSLAAMFFGPDVWDVASNELLRANMRLVIEGGRLSSGKEVVGSKDHARRIGDMSKRLGCPILAGGSALVPNPRPTSRRDRWVTTNAAILFDRSPRAEASYAKVHLVPFGEYVPFKYSWPALHRLLRRFVPPAMEQIEPGRQFTRFELTRNSRSWRLASPICFEGTFARICRKMVMRDGRKSVDILANLSNDGWFVWNWGEGPYRSSTEHAQHLATYVFRAVENRVPVIRAVNTGISASVNSNGRIEAKLNRHGVSAMVSGTLLLDGGSDNAGEYLPQHGPQVLVDRRVSVYSVVGDVFAIAMSLAMSGIALLLGLKRRRDGEEVNK